MGLFLGEMFAVVGIGGHPLPPRGRRACEPQSLGKLLTRSPLECLPHHHQESQHLACRTLPCWTHLLKEAAASHRPAWMLPLRLFVTFCSRHCGRSHLGGSGVCSQAQAVHSLVAVTGKNGDPHSEPKSGEPLAGSSLPLTV